MHFYALNGVLTHGMLAVLKSLFNMLLELSSQQMGCHHWLLLQSLNLCVMLHAGEMITQ